MPLCIFFPKMSAYREEKLKIYLLIKDDELLGKYNGIRKNIKNIKNEPVFTMKSI